MGWQFWKRRPNPLDTESLRELDARIDAGDLRSVSEELKRRRQQSGETPALVYLEGRVYYEGSAVPPDELLKHLRSALDDDALKFPEAELLGARLLAACGRLDDAARALEELQRSRRLKPALADGVRTALASLERVRGDVGRQRIEEQATILASELRGQGVQIRWRASDLARVDSLIDEQPNPVHDDRARWTSLIGEVAVRTGAGRWRLTPRAEDRAVVLGDRGDRVWQAGKALKDRLLTGAPLYESLHRALGTPFQPVAGMPGAEVVVEPAVHPAVVCDHAARALLEAGATGLGVFRIRPTPDGPVRLPVSFVDKADALRVLYVETRPWDEATIADLRRWVWRLRTSAARHAEVSLLSAEPAPAAATDLAEGKAEAPAPIVGLLDQTRDGSGQATPRSLDEPKLRWLDDKAEIMERLVRAAIGTVEPSDLEIVKKVQSTVTTTFRNRDAAADLTPKQWNALYGYGALYGRILARTLDGRWSGLADDTQPMQWEMLLRDGRSVRPIGVVVKLAQLGPDEADLVNEFMALRAADRAGGNE